MYNKLVYLFHKVLTTSNYLDVRQNSNQNVQLELF